MRTGESSYSQLCLRTDKIRIMHNLCHTNTYTQTNRDQNNVHQPELDINKFFVSRKC